MTWKHVDAYNQFFYAHKQFDSILSLKKLLEGPQGRTIPVHRRRIPVQHRIAGGLTEQDHVTILFSLLLTKWQLVTIWTEFDCFQRLGYSTGFHSQVHALCRGQEERNHSSRRLKYCSILGEFVLYLITGSTGTMTIQKRICNYFK